MISWKKFENKETEVLIDFFQNPNNEEFIKDDAFLALCFRFREDLLNKCERICRNRGYDIDVAQQIAEDTFKRYGKFKGFKIEKGKQSNIDKCFKVYLYKISSNLLNDYYRKEEKRIKGQLYDGTEELITRLPDIEIDLLDIESQIIHDTLTKLPYSHQVIYMTYEAHKISGVNLPRKLQAKLREHLGGIDQSTVRGYKKEAIDQIENAKGIIKKLKTKV
jgi:DNA-directed RNA polymerase specialized sigma24 family protein